MKRVRVTIADSKLIPTIGKGPILRPISITVAQYEMLKKFGFKIVKVDEQLVTKIEEVEKIVVPSEPQDETPVNVPVEDSVSELEETEVVETEEVTIESEVVEDEETVEEEVDLIGTVFSEEDLAEATKDELKEILDARGVKYKYSATLPSLKEAVVESNPQE
jgi:hypothetical protein